MSTNVVDVIRLQDTEYGELRALREALIAGTLTYRFVKSDYFRPYHRYYTVSVQAPDGRLIRIGWVVGDPTTTDPERPVWRAYKCRPDSVTGIEVYGGKQRQSAAENLAWSATR